MSRVLSARAMARARAKLTSEKGSRCRSSREPNFPIHRTCMGLLPDNMIHALSGAAGAVSDRRNIDNRLDVHKAKIGGCYQLPFSILGLTSSVVVQLSQASLATHSIVELCHGESIFAQHYPLCVACWGRFVSYTSFACDANHTSASSILALITSL